MEKIFRFFCEKYAEISQQKLEQVEQYFKIAFFSCLIALIADFFFF